VFVCILCVYLSPITDAGSTMPFRRTPINALIFPLSYTKEIKEPSAGRGRKKRKAAEDPLFPAPAPKHTHSRTAPRSDLPSHTPHTPHPTPSAQTSPHPNTAQIAPNPALFSHHSASHLNTSMSTPHTQQFTSLTQ